WFRSSRQACSWWAALRARGSVRGVCGMLPIIKQEHIAIGEGMRVVLVPKLLAAPLPGKGATMPVNDRHGVEETKAGEHVTIGQHFTGVGMRPFMPPIQ